LSEPTMIPDWVLTEVGRLHLHALALERELAARAQQQEGGDAPPLPTDTFVLEKDGIRIYHTREGGFVAADGAGWVRGVYGGTPGEAHRLAVEAIAQQMTEQRGSDSGDPIA